MPDTYFNEEWLKLRWAFDRAARNENVAVAAYANWQTASSKVMVDLGAGLGANCAYWAPRLQGVQHWYLIEHDQRLFVPGIQWLARYFAQAQWSHTTQAGAELFEGPDCRVGVQYIQGNAEQMAQLVDLKAVNGVMANALLDLLRWDQCHALAGILADFRLPLLATINYMGMAFEPADAWDSLLIGLYEQHMTRPQSQGPRLGKQAVLVLAEMLEKRGYVTVHGPADWVVPPRACSMQRALLDFMASAIAQLDLLPHMRQQVQAWFQLREQHVQAQCLTIRVKHVDLWATPR